MYFSYFCKMGNIIYNYFKIVDEDGDIVGVGGVEKGSDNEVRLIDDILKLNFKLEKITEQEYNEYDEGVEIRNF